MSKPSNRSVLSYWRSALFDDAQMKISFKKEELVIIDVETLKRGTLPADKTAELRRLHPKSQTLTPEDPIIVMAGLRILMGEVNHTTSNARLPTLSCMAALLTVDPDGTISCCGDTAPWINRDLLEPSDTGVTIGEVSVLDEWLQVHPLQTTKLPEMLTWSDAMWDAVTKHDFPEGYKLWGQIPLQAAESSIGMLATQHQRRFYDSVLENEKYISPLLERYLSGTSDTKDVSGEMRWEAALYPRGTMTADYGMSPTQGEAMAAFTALDDFEILAVNGPPGTGKTTLLQGVVATEMVVSAMRGEDPPLIAGTSTNNQAVTNIIDAMKKAMAGSGDSKRSWEKRWIEDADALGLYFPSLENMKPALASGYLIAMPGRGLETREWKGFPERERDVDNHCKAVETWVEGFYACFSPGTSPQRQTSETPGIPPYSLDLIKRGLGTIQDAMQSLHTLGNAVVTHARELGLLFEKSGFATESEIQSRIDACEALIAEREPERCNLEKRLLEARDLTINAQTKLKNLSDQIHRELATLERELDAARASAKSVGEFAVILISELPEGGFLGNFLAGKSWAKAESIAANGPDTEHFRPLMQNQKRDRQEWMTAINALTDKTDQAVFALENKHTAHNRGVEGELRQEQSAVNTAKKKQEDAHLHLDTYTNQTRDLAQKEQQSLTSLLQKIRSLRRAVPQQIEEALTKNKWGAKFGLTSLPNDEALPWDSAEWTGSLLSVEGYLDRTVRYALFQLSLRYWEGRWILEVAALQDALEKNDNSAYPFRVGARAIEKMYRRWAMLTPLFVITAASLPKLPKARVKVGDKFEEQYLTDLFDLLIVDEAGQIAPYQLVPGMAFSHQAIVVGDVYQLEPVVTTSHETDTGNARKADVQRYFWDEEGPIDPKVVTAAPGNGNLMGSVMRVVQEATSFSSPGSMVPGIFLSEHRRCRRDIIEICNELVYKGRLKPMTAEPKTPPPLPPLSWANVNGVAERAGGSQRNPREAQAIAQWISSHADEWRTFYKTDLDKLVAIITPYGAQRDAIRHALRQCAKTFQDEQIGKIRVGTVNSMQGAECKIVVFSPTCDKKSSTTFLEGKKSLLNVAISRAEHSFVVIGTMEIMERNPSSTLGTLGEALLTNGVELAGVQGNWAAADSLILEGERLSTVDNHHRLLDEALGALKDGEEIVIVSPFLSSSAVSTPEIQEGIRQAVQRGAVVSVVTRSERSADFRYGTNPDLRQQLSETGARLHDIKLLHSKTLMTPTFIAEGSFNWLSVRRGEPRYANLDTTWVLTGSQAEVAKKMAIDELNEHLRGSKSGEVGLRIQPQN